MPKCADVNSPAAERNGLWWHTHTHRDCVLESSRKEKCLERHSRGFALLVCVCVSVLPREDLIELPFCTHAGSLNVCGVHVSTARVLHFSIILSNDGTGPAAAHAPRMCVYVCGVPLESSLPCAHRQRKRSVSCPILQALGGQC